MTDPVLWVYRPDRSAAAEAGPHALADLPWLRWTPRPSIRPAGVGSALKEFTSAHPGQPLLLLAPDTLAATPDLQKLHSIGRQLKGPQVLTMLSNAREQMNPFAGLDVSRLTEGSRADPSVLASRMAGLVRLLGSGVLHPLEEWPGHLLYFTPEAVDVLADPGITARDALARLGMPGGRAWVVDSLFALAARETLNHLTELEPHEKRRPAPWGDLSARLELYLARASALPSLPASADTATTLHITHSWGGGVAQWVESFITADSGACNLQLRSEGPQSGQGTGQRLSLYFGNEVNAPLASWWLNPAIRSTADTRGQYREILGHVIHRYGVGRIIISSLVGHSLDALRTGQATMQVLHDFFPAWPLLGVHPQPYLVLEAPERLEAALRDHELLGDFRDHDADGWRRLADTWRSLAISKGVKMVAPGNSVAALLRELDPGWEHANIDIVQHGIEPLPVELPIPARERTDGKLRLVVAGRMQEGKGQLLLLEALPRLTQYAQVYLLGTGKQGEAFFGRPGVNVVLQYRRDELPALIREIGPHVAALLSVVPETFSYTLSEIQQMGLPVIATRVGSLAERIEDGRTGWLIDPTADALVGMVSRLAAHPELLDEQRARLGGIEHVSTADMVRRYAEICPAPVIETEVSRFEDLAGLQFAAASEHIALLDRTRAGLESRVEELNREVERRTEWAQERDRAVRDEQTRRERWVGQLEEELSRLKSIIGGLSAELQVEKESLAAAQEQINALFASSSWRITRPLRVSRRMLANLRRARAWDPRRWPLLLSQSVRIMSTLGLSGALLRFQQSTQQGPQPAAFPGAADPIGDPKPPPAVPCSLDPEVSIVIPVYNQWVYTAACLRSLCEARCETPFEVIVVDDCSTDETARFLEQVEGLNCLKNEQNLGFIGSCNRGAEEARGRYILLLNNDTQVLDGWLDALLDTFVRFPDTGLAGARLVYPDGRLQEAGGMVFSDGSGWNYGRGDDPRRPEYSFTREVDYCSGACIMMPADLYQRLGGLDTRYVPAYYEDTDLAFKVREAGFKVRVQAAATIIHHEGVSSGTDLNSGIKRFQAVNRDKFHRRWRERLDEYPAPIANPDDRGSVRRARDHRLRGRVLIIDAYTPEPDQDSGSLRLRYLFDCFAARGYGVTFFADNRGYAGRYTSELQSSGIEVLYDPWIESLQDFFSSRGPDFDYIMISRHYVAANYLAWMQRYCRHARFIFDTVDLHYLREERLAELENSLPLKRVAAQTRRSELSVIRQADATLVVSPVEQSVLAKDAPGAKVHVLSNIHRVTGSRNGFDDREGILFVGGYQHPPNVDAAIWFVNAIWPLVRRELPDIRFHLIGSKAPQKVRALHGNGVEFHGFVRDLEPFLDGCRLAIAPLRYGAGVKGKVNLSMSHGQPVVATPIAIEGLFGEDGKDLLVAETPEEFAAAVIRLYRDKDLWNTLSEGGLENVRRHFSIERAQENLQAILDSLEAG